MKLHFKQNSAAIILRSFLAMLIVITVLSSGMTVLATGHQLLVNTSINSTNIVHSLKKRDIDSDDDWENWRVNSTLNTSTSYVRVHNDRDDAAVKYYYSPGAKRLLAGHLHKIPVFAHLYYEPGFGFLYHTTGDAYKIHYQLWTNMNSQFKLLGRIVLVALLVLLATLIISPFYIRFLTNRLTAPLANLTRSAENATKTTSREKLQLPVPDKPTETTQLALSFNSLLSRQHDQAEKEKLFISNAAHELRTPIATIRSHAQLIERRAKAHPEVIAQSVKYIDDESHQMETLVEELLALTRADRATFDFEQYDLSASLVALAKNTAPLFPQRLVTEIDSGIQLTAHEASVTQIVTNLLNNASKYAEPNTTIKLVLKLINDQTVIQVIDEGSGIAAEDKAHIFERFYRSSNVRGTIPGTGLGLAIVAELASLNGAKLTLNDNVPQGSIFSVRFGKRVRNKGG